MRIFEKMGPDFDPKEVLGVREGSKEGSQDDAKDKKFGDWRVGEPGSDHLVDLSGWTQAHLGTLDSRTDTASFDRWLLSTGVVHSLPHQLKSCLSGSECRQVRDTNAWGGT